MNLSTTSLVIVGAEWVRGRAAEALRASHLIPIPATRHTAIEAKDHEVPPWHWSDQHDASIQNVGHPGGGETVRADIAFGHFTRRIPLRLRAICPRALVVERRSAEPISTSSLVS